ncbi:MAG: hypothetical protein KPEEDBHJ_02606 [Anaerolineales bacterium]|nr:hypothetical protein [Anaerolineales bacterium]
MITGLGVNDADVGHGRLGKYGGNVAGGEGGFERGDVVELDDFGRLARVNLRAHVVRARDGRAFFVECDEGFVHRAVIAIVEDEDFFASRDEPRHAEGESIRVGGGEGELPIGKFEAALEFFADPDHILIRKHERDAFLNLLVDGFDRRVRAVTGHCAGVAEAEINV